MRWRPDVCKCVIDYDGYDETGEVINATSFEVCEHHTGLTDKKLHDTILAECRLKEQAKQDLKDIAPEAYHYVNNSGSPVLVSDNGTIRPINHNDINETDAASQGLSLVLKPDALDWSFDENRTLKVELSDTVLDDKTTTTDTLNQTFGDKIEVI